MRFYVGMQVNGISAVLVYDPSRSPRQFPLIARPELVRAPSGSYLWGAAAPGSLVLAVSLLVDATGDESLAVQYGPSFDQQIVQQLRGEFWCISAEEVLYGLVGAQRQAYAEERHIPGLSVGTSGDNMPPAGTQNVRLS